MTSGNAFRLRPGLDGGGERSRSLSSLDHSASSIRAQPGTCKIFAPGRRQNNGFLLRVWHTAARTYGSAQDAAKDDVIQAFLGPVGNRVAGLGVTLGSRDGWEVVVSVSRCRLLSLGLVFGLLGCTAAAQKSHPGVSASDHVNPIPSLSALGSNTPTLSPSPSGQPSESSTVAALASPSVAFTGDAVSVVTQVVSSTPVALAIIRIDFGDGTVLTPSPAECRPRPVTERGVVRGVPVVHRFITPGQHTVRVWSTLGCGGQHSTEYSIGRTVQFPMAPSQAESWQRCLPGQLSATTVEQGAATGHVGLQGVLRNDSNKPCHLQGYPGLQLFNAKQEALHTSVVWGGSFLFPAVVPHLVGLAPDQAASFDVAYGDNPVGNPPPAYDTACPRATSLAIIPPDDTQPVNAAAALAPCGGNLNVSPIMPGTTWIPFE